MLKRVISILAALAVFAGCQLSITIEDEVFFSVTGEIIDPDASLGRLLHDMHVTATDKSNGKVYAGSVGTEDAVTCRYSLKDLPSGEYDILFSSSLYEEAKYSLTVDSDKVLDVSLSPVPQIATDVDEIHFAPRVKSQVFSVTNLTEKVIPLTLKPDAVIEGFIESISGFRKGTGHSGWHSNSALSPGETRRITILASHDQEESLLQGVLDIQMEGILLASLPFVMETSNRDFFANLVGQVTDGQGLPLKDIPVYCNCTDTIVLTDENGRYSFDDLPYLSQVYVIALSEFHNWKMSDFKDYIRDEIVIDLTLEPCSNHLTFDRQEIDLGTGSVSHPGDPVSVYVNVTPETDAPVMFLMQTKVVGGNVYPGLNYLANGMIQSPRQLWFSLDRSVAEVGDFQFTAILKTDCAGTYLFPVRFTNTE